MASFEETVFQIKITGDAAGITGAARETKTELGGVATAGTKAHEEVSDGAIKSTVSHKEMRQAVKGLRGEFPELYHVAHLALHPITLAVAGIGGAFKLMAERVRSLQELFGGFEMPQVKEAEVGHINAAALAWESYRAALSKVVEAGHSVEAQTDREIAKIKLQLELRKALIEAELATNKAAIGAAKEGKAISGPQAEHDSLQAEIQATTQKRQAEEEAQRKELAAKSNKAIEQIEDGRRKAFEAGRIKVASKEDDDSTLAEMKVQHDAAAKDKEEREKRLEALNAVKSGNASLGQEFGSVWRMVTTQMSSAELAKLEKEGIEADKTRMEPYKNRLRQMHDRDLDRENRKGLLDDAAKQRGEGEKYLLDQMPADEQAAAARSKAGAKTDLLGILTKGYTAAEHGEQESNRLAKEIVEQIKSNNAMLKDTVAHASAQSKYNDEIKQWIGEIEAQVKRLR